MFPRSPCSVSRPHLPSTLQRPSTQGGADNQLRKYGWHSTTTTCSSHTVRTHRGDTRTLKYSRAGAKRLARSALPLTQYLCHPWGGNNPIARTLLGVVWNDLGTARKSGAHPGDRALRTFLRTWNPTEERSSQEFPPLRPSSSEESQGCT